MVNKVFKEEEPLDRKFWLFVLLLCVLKMTWGGS